MTEHINFADGYQVVHAVPMRWHVYRFMDHRRTFCTYKGARRFITDMLEASDNER